MSLYLMIDTIHGVQTGNVRGLGKQGPASVIILICYYAFGVPLAIYLGFYRDWRLLGFWSGMLTAITISQLLIAYLVITADWNFIENDDGAVQTKVVDDIELMRPIKQDSDKKDSIR